LHQVSHQIRETFSSDSRGGNETQVLVHVRVLVVHASVETLLSEGNYGFSKSIFVLLAGVIWLDSESISEVSVLLRFPLVASVDLVEGHDEGALLLPEKLHRFERLLLKPVHEIHDENGDIAQGGSTGPKVGEGLVTRSINN
jgi:hypothetical protein